MTIDEAIKHCEEVADGFDETAQEIARQDENGVHQPQVSWYQDRASSQRQLAKWLRELKRYRKQIQNLIDNESFEIVNPFNTYEYARVVRVADLYDLTEVNANEERSDSE